MFGFLKRKKTLPLDMEDPATLRAIGDAEWENGHHEISEMFHEMARKVERTQKSPSFSLNVTLREIEGGMEIPPDGIVCGIDADSYIDGGGQVIRRIHSEEKCVGRHCAIHNPSDHRMREFPTNFRWDTYLMERICPHGVGHPDPDDMIYHTMVGDEHKAIHGCDGCCGSLGPPEAAVMDTPAWGPDHPSYDEMGQ